MYLLDTSTCIALLEGSSRTLVENFRRHDPSVLRLCSVSKAELLHAARTSQTVAKHLSLLQTFFGPLTCLPFDDRCGEHYAQLRAQLDGDGQILGTLDLMIAATALGHDMVLVTADPQRFSGIPGLPIADWSGEDPAS